MDTDYVDANADDNDDDYDEPADRETYDEDEDRLAGSLVAPLWRPATK